MNDETRLLLAAIRTQRFGIRIIAGFYAWALAARYRTTDWPQVNAAIMDRWPFMGLDLVKWFAWHAVRKAKRDNRSVYPPDA